ncbi:MAG: hypothetical protein Q7V31_12060 [Parvibaculum sp.]|uniref:phage nozzle protein n=1 Tax=Parvibaculum sp. TaxID=2024848 RepID=UPI002717A76B|nr:hypothetical protein [Parvibaculum sp.]MDO8839651.1 hypothetical protein [Parvibaculum sp.]
MTRVIGSVPNLVNGVSQQPDTLKLPSQARAVVNGYTSVVSGLSKRLPTLHRGRVSAGALGNIYTHWINRDSAERYVVVISNGDLKVFDLAGNEKTVAFPNGKAYLNNANPLHGFAAVTVSDFTFIANKAVTVLAGTTKTALLEEQAVFWFRAGNYTTKYIATIDGANATFLTCRNNDTLQSTYVATDHIAERLWQGNDGAGSLAAYTGMTGGLNALSGATYTKSRSDNYIAIKRNSGVFSSIDFTDGYGDVNTRLIYRSVKTVADLPPKCVNSMRLKVLAKEGASVGDYWVQFATKDGTSFGEGGWKECPAPDMVLGTNPATMPHQLVRESDGTFTFKQAAWKPRDVGDDDSNPLPSFIGEKIKDVYFNRNRLGFLAGENVILSEAGEYFSFTRATVTTTLDTDFIDVSVAHVKASTLSAAIPVKRNLVLFSDQTQFVLGSPATLTASTVSVTPVTEYENVSTARPIANGRFVYFVSEAGATASVREFYVADDSEAQSTSSVELTAHVPSYIPSGVFLLEPSTTVDMIATLSSAAPDTIFVYKYFWQGNDRVQNAWTKWQFGDGVVVRSVKFFQSSLYLLVQRASGTFIESIELSEKATDTHLPFIVRLDRRITEAQCTSVAYSAGTGLTTWTLPFVEAGAVQVVVRAPSADPAGTSIPHTRPSSTTVSAFGDYTSTPVFIGKVYTLRYTFSDFVVRRPSSGGGEVVVKDGRVQVKTLRVTFDNTAQFAVEVEPAFREVSRTLYTGHTLGDGAAILGSPVVDSGDVLVMVMSKNDQVRIDLVNDSYLPSTFISAEWTAEFTPKSKSI